MRTLRLSLVGTVILMLLGGASMAGASDEQQDPESEVALVQAQLDEVTAERDALLLEKKAAADRFERSRATQQMVFDIIADPSAFGSQEEVLDLLDQLAVPGTVYGDDAFGSIGWRAGWRNTLFGNVDATIHTWRSWLSDDGSVGGSMWTWSGNARNGEPFDLQGINLDTYDESGLQDSVTVYYPYEDAEVERRFNEGG